MSVYIEGMKMPTKQVLAVINPDGLVEILNSDNILIEEFQATQIAPHGRLGDFDRMLADNETYYNRLGRPSGVIEKNYMAVKRSIEIAPTVIPADPAEEGE